MQHDKAQSRRSYFPLCKQKLAATHKSSGCRLSSSNQVDLSTYSSMRNQTSFECLSMLSGTSIAAQTIGSVKISHTHFPLGVHTVATNQFSGCFVIWNLSGSLSTICSFKTYMLHGRKRDSLNWTPQEMLQRFNQNHTASSSF